MTHQSVGSGWESLCRRSQLGVESSSHTPQGSHLLSAPISPVLYLSSGMGCISDSADHYLTHNIVADGPTRVTYYFDVVGRCVNVEITMSTL